MYLHQTKSRIAILGATGYIGRSLTAWALEKDLDVTVFSRDVDKAFEAFRSYGIKISSVSDYQSFLDNSYEVVINATGIGSPRVLSTDPLKVFDVTESMDNLVFDYLEKHPNTRVFNLSSGVVYGQSVGKSIDDDTLSVFSADSINPGDCYAVAKFASEVKHRAVTQKHIIDLRVFAFVSRFLDIEEPFFIAEVARCLKSGNVFYTKANDMIRDYSTAEDIWNIVDFLTEQPAQNEAFDIRSSAPVGKFELLESLSHELGLKYEIKDIEASSPTGEKDAYYSNSEKLTKLGFKSKLSSSENVLCEISSFLTSKN